MVSIGVVMLQGARDAHIQAVRDAAKGIAKKVNVVELRTVEDLEVAISSGLNAIILPGGESTTMRLTGNAAGNGLLPALFAHLRNSPDLPLLATCAGVILLADPQDGGAPLISAKVNRNAYGRQRDSFQATLSTRTTESEQLSPFPGVFIRAPRFTDTAHSTPVATRETEVVGIRENNRVALTFHPELSGDYRFHEWLIRTAEEVSR